MCVFFFSSRRRHTRWPRDWSSDVCSSDLPEDRRLTRDVIIPPGHEGKAGEGDVVVVRITEWGNHHLGPTGEIDHVLGPATKPGVDILTVVYGHGLPIEFPEEVLEEAVALRERGIQEEDLQGRTDQIGRASCRERVENPE